MPANPYEMRELKTHKLGIQRLNNRIVERYFLMKLERREDRLKDWLRQLPDLWPFPQPERFSAIDGQRCTMPAQWRADNGRGAVPARIA